MIEVLVFMSCVWTGHAAINHLNESEYARMPPLFRADSYGACAARGGRYCTATVHLVSDGPSELMDMIQEYSSHALHFNHSKLLHGICVTDACASYNSTGDLRTSLEACLNESLWKSHGLHARLEPTACGGGSEGAKVEALDMLFAGALVILLLLLITATFREITERKSSKFLSCFSVVSNWRRLTAPSELSTPHLEGMKAFYGLKTIGTVWVIGVHALLVPAIASENPRDFEQLTDTLKFFCGSGVAINVFFIMSGCLLAYNLEAYKETRAVHWSMVPKKIMLRWLRLVTPLLIPLGVASTWLRFPRPLPYWQMVVGEQAESCAQDWWKVVFMVINYVPGSVCMPDIWYVAADMQLTILGLIVHALVPARARARVLGALFVLGVVAPAVITYLNDLDGITVITPEEGRQLMHKNPTFNLVYKPGHTNVVCYVQGLMLGAWVRRLQVTGFQVDTYQKPWHKYAFCCLYPVFFLCVLLCSMFILVQPGTSLFTRTIFAAIYRPVFGFVFCSMLLGYILRLQEPTYKFLSGRVFVPMSRVCYCAYAVHLGVVRLYAATRTELVYVTGTYVFLNLLCTTVASLGLAVLLWLAVEAPMAQVIKLTFMKIGWIQDPAKTETTERKSEIANNNNEVQSGKDSVSSNVGENNVCKDKYEDVDSNINKIDVRDVVGGKAKTE